MGIPLQGLVGWWSTSTAWMAWRCASTDSIGAARKADLVHQAGCPAVDEGQISRTCSPTTKSSESYVPYFSDGGRSRIPP